MIILNKIFSIGQFLTKKILQNETGLELAFVWNRSKESLQCSEINKEHILENLEKCASRKPDLIVEVAHPIVVEKVSEILYLFNCAIYIQLN